MSETNIGGIYLPPAIVYILAAVMLFTVVNFVIRKIKLDVFVWHLALFEISIGLIIFSALVIYF